MSQNFRIGLFLIATLAILTAGVFLVGQEESKFVSSYKVQSQFQTVAGLVEGADVRVGGIRKGAVRRIDLPKNPDGLVTITMDIAKETRGIVKKDSVASIHSEGLLGDKYVEVSFGSDDAANLKDGETIGSEPPFDFSELLGKTRGVLDTAQSALEGIQKTSDNLATITSKVNSGQGSAGKLINDNTLYQQASAGLTALHEDADALKHNFFLRGFFNNRGYASSEEIKKNEIAQVPKEAPSRDFRLDPKAIFDQPDSAKLKNSKVLTPSGEYLQAQKFSLAVIAVTSGAKGDSLQEKVLSGAKAYVIRKYLVENFKLDDTKVKTIGLGKNPETPDGSITIYVYDNVPVPAAKPPGRG